MKATGKIIGRLIVGCMLACCLTSNLHAQSHAIPWDWSGITLEHSSTNEANEVQDQKGDPLQIQINGLPQVPATMIPQSGTFWSLQGALQVGGYPPLPFNPFATNTDVKVYSFSDGSFLLNDLSMDYDALRSNAETNAPSNPVPNYTPPSFNYTWLTLLAPSGSNPGQLIVDTKDWGGGWIWGIAAKTELNTYDPRQESWELLDPNYFAYDLNGSNYSFSMPPFDQDKQFFKSFNVQDYFQGSWTPIKYLGCNIPAGASVTTNDVVMRFNLEGDIYKFFTNIEQSVQATVVRPSGESIGCFADISSNGIATITAPAGSFASGQNYVWVSFVNQGPTVADTVPDVNLDDGYFPYLTVDQQEDYLASQGMYPTVSGSSINNQPHNFTGYLVFNAVPPVEDSIAAPYMTPFANGSTAFTRTYKYQGGVNASFTVQLFTPDNQLIAETNGVTQLDGNNEYTFEADLDIPDNVLTNVDFVTAVVQAESLDAQAQGGGAIPNANQPSGPITMNYIIDHTKFNGIYNTAAWCSYSYGIDPLSLTNTWLQTTAQWDILMDAFISDAADTVLTDIGLIYQTGFTDVQPDPNVLNLLPALEFRGSGQVAHISDVLTNSLYMGFNFISHSGAGTDLFDDADLNLSALSQAAGNHDSLGKFVPGQPVPRYFSYKRRMDVWMEGSCLGAWRYDAEYFGTPRDVDQTHAQVLRTVAFGYDNYFFVIPGCKHFKRLGDGFYTYTIFNNGPLNAAQALNYAASFVDLSFLCKPAFQGSPFKTFLPNRN